MAPRLKRITKVKCPHCQSSTFTVYTSVLTTNEYEVNDGNVEDICFFKMKNTLHYNFKCHNCGGGWESETFFATIV